MNTPLNPASLKKSNPDFMFLTIILLIVASISGCDAKKEQRPYSKDEAEIEFIQICEDEYNWNVNTKFIGNTLWIYLPYEKDIFKFKADRFTEASKFSVIFLEGSFQDETFYFEYQIEPLLKLEEDKGYTYGLLEAVNEDFYYLLNVIYRVYFNSKQQPEFYIVTMADIVNGVEVIYTIYNEDLKKIYNNAIAQEESYKRILQDMRGNLAIIEDKTGSHLSYKETTMGQFLAKQIVQRIRYRFLSTDFKLQRAKEEEILKIISYCLNTYNFEGFVKVVLKDLSSGIETIKDRRDLKEIKEF